MLPNDILCLREVRRLINYLPSNNQQRPPILDLKDPLERTDPALDYLIPANPNQTYDMKVLIRSVLDGAEFLEIQSHFARNIICGFGRMGGQTVGLIANQPAVLAGVLDINASTKAARFVRFCDAFNIPLICFVDVPGFMPGPEQESRRDHPPRRQAAVRLRRGHRAAHHRHPAQGLRRGLHRDELEAHRLRTSTTPGPRPKSPCSAPRARRR